MRNKKTVPILEETIKQSIIIHHGDLDGYCGAQVCQKWLESNFGVNHIVELCKATYENVNLYAERYFSEADQYLYILIVDISVNEEMSKSAPNNVYIFDHHDTSKYLEDISDRFYWNNKYCGAVVACQSLFQGKLKDKPFLKLLKICDDYDMWRGADDQPPELSYQMETLFWRDPDKWYMRFYDGFKGFNKEEQKYISSIWNIQDELWENKIDKLVYDAENPNVIFLTVDDDRWNANWWCNFLLNTEGLNVVIIYRAINDRLSIRTNRKTMDWWHAGEWLRGHINNTNNSKGGHAAAAGCSTEGMTVEEVLMLGQTIEDLCKEHFNG